MVYKPHMTKRSSKQASALLFTVIIIKHDFHFLFIQGVSTE
jgi:hypothetical protein